MTWYIVSNGKLLAEYDGIAKTLRYKYIYSGDQRIAMRDGVNRLHYYLNDHLGSARVVIDSAGTIKDKYHYLAFGSPLDVTTSTGQPNKYTGKPYDMDAGMNLYYYGARYYDAELGRFTQVDPARGRFAGWSPFAYTFDNPMRHTDPDGMAAKDLQQRELSAALSQHERANPVSRLARAEATVKEGVYKGADAVSNYAGKGASATGYFGGTMLYAGAISKSTQVLTAGAVVSGVSLALGVAENAAEWVKQQIRPEPLGDLKIMINTGLMAVSKAVQAPLAKGAATATDAKGAQGLIEVLTNLLTDLNSAATNAASQKDKEKFREDEADKSK